MATTDDDAAAPGWGRRVAWLLALWLAGVMSLGLLAGLLGWVLQAVGLQR